MKRRARPILGTLVEIGFEADLPDEEVNQLSALAFEAIEEIHRLMSFHSVDSDVSRFNVAEPGVRVVVHAHTLRVLAFALELEQSSDGVFNPGVAPLLVEMGQLPAPCEPVPTVARLADMLEMTSNTIRKKAPGWLDLGGVAKGYAVDMACERLLECGASGFVVNAGGDLRVHGIDHFEARIRDPENPLKGALALGLKDQALATSGCYFSDALVDPRTEKSMALRHSVSVVAPTCMAADALTKIIACTGQIDHPTLKQHKAKALTL